MCVYRCVCIDVCIVLYTRAQCYIIYTQYYIQFEMKQVIKTVKCPFALIKLEIKIYNMSNSSFRTSLIVKHVMYVNLLLM